MSVDRPRRRFGDADADPTSDPATDGAALDDVGTVFGRGTATADADDRAPSGRDGRPLDSPLSVEANGLWSRFVRAGGPAGASTVAGPLRTRRARALRTLLTTHTATADVTTTDVPTHRTGPLHVEAPSSSVDVIDSAGGVHTVEFEILPLDASAWARVVDVFASSAGHAAALIDGRLPDDVDDIFASIGAALVPTDDDIVEIRCSCTGGSEMCSHVASAVDVVVRAVDTDPLVLFAIRGRTRAAVLEELASRRRESAEVDAAPARDLFSSADDGRRELFDHLGADPRRFWSAGPLPPPTLPSPPRGNAAAVLDESSVGVVVGRDSAGDVTFDDLLRGAYPGIRRGAMARLRRLGAPADVDD